MDETNDEPTYRIKVRRPEGRNAASGGDPVPDEDEDPVIIEDDPEDDGMIPVVIEEAAEASPAALHARREVLRLEEQVRKLQAEIYQERVKTLAAEERVKEREDQALRAQSDFQNYRRRIEREREEAARYAHADLLRDLLPVVDNFDRAMQSAAGASAEDFQRGVALIRKQVSDVFEKYELREMDALGQPFDPNFHEAVTRMSDPTIPVDHVKAVLQKGFYYGERLLRPALVAVSSGDEADADSV